MELEPLQDVLVLELVEDSVLSKGSGLVLPDGYAKEKEEGAVFKVLASGPGCWDADHFVANLIKVGDYIITAAYGISKFKYNGKPVILARERDVILRLKGKGV